MCAVCIKQSAGLQSSCDHTFGGQISNCRRHPKLSSLGSRALSRHLGQLRRTEAIDGIFSRCCWDLLRSRRRVARPTSSSPPRPTRPRRSADTFSRKPGCGNDHVGDAETTPCRALQQLTAGTRYVPTDSYSCARDAEHCESFCAHPKLKLVVLRLAQRTFTSPGPWPLSCVYPLSFVMAIERGGLTADSAR